MLVKAACIQEFIFSACSSYSLFQITTFRLKKPSLVISYKHVDSHSANKTNQRHSLVKIGERINSKSVLFIELVTIRSCNCILGFPRTLKLQEAVSNTCKSLRHNQHQYAQKLYYQAAQCDIPTQLQTSN
jgi:hypothetical protein